MPGQEAPQTFAELVDSYYERIFRGAISVTGDKHLAEELVQETFLAAFRKLHSFSGRSSVFAWLYGIMLNKYRIHCRRNSLLKRLGFVRAGASSGQAKNVVSGDSSPYLQLAKLEEIELLMKAVSNLPFKLREVVAMRYFDGLSLNQVAEILSCRLGTVKSRLCRARERLARTLQGRLT